MKHNKMKNDFRKRLVIYGICFLFICISIAPAAGTISKMYYSISSLINNSERTSEGDIPTWYQGDQCIYTIDPLYYSSPNGTFSGTIENFKQKVVGIINDTYRLRSQGILAEI